MRLGVLITSMDRRDLLIRSLNSLKVLKHLPFLQIVVVDQSKEYPAIQNEVDIDHTFYCIPFDSGLSQARNIGVQELYDLGCTHVLVMADSIEIKPILADYIAKLYDEMDFFEYDIIGLPLENRIPWNGILEFEKELCFVIKRFPFTIGGDLYVRRADIVSNFFIAKIKPLIETQWDNDLKLREHEDFFWRFKNNGYYVGYVMNEYYGNYIGVRGEEYAAIRAKNMNEGLAILKKKYNIKSWLKQLDLKELDYVSNM